jgi:hypothetical protein
MPFIGSITRLQPNAVEEQLLIGSKTWTETAETPSLLFEDQPCTTGIAVINIGFLSAGQQKAILWPDVNREGCPEGTNLGGVLFECLNQFSTADVQRVLFNISQIPDMRDDGVEGVNAVAANLDRLRTKAKPGLVAGLEFVRGGGFEEPPFGLEANLVRSH